MAVRQVIGVVGAAVGYWIGGPTGAQYGWSIGTIAGNIFDPQVFNGPKIAEVAQQTSQEGGPRPIVFGLSPPISGNIIAAGPLIKRTRKEDQGKGGPKVKVTSLYRAYAIGVCEGPITRFVRVWRNGELVFDDKDDDEENYYISGDPTFIDVVKAIIRARKNENNQAFLETVSFHLGDYDQEADPDLEAVFGVGTTPAHRGTAYMAMAGHGGGDDVTDLRGAIPQYMFQVERCEGSYLTSRVYSIENTEALMNSGSAPRESPSEILIEALDNSGSVEGGELRDPLIEYEDAEPEALDSSGALVDGLFRDPLIEYEDAEPEALDSSGELLSGDLDEILITYTDGLPEALDTSGTLESGSLS